MKIARISMLTLGMEIAGVVADVPSLHAGVPFQTGQRSVRLAIRFSASIPAMQISAREGETATVTLTDIGKFGFQPNFRKGDEKVVIVTIFDAATEPHRQLGLVEAPVGGDSVESKTSPPFGIRVTGVSNAK